MATILQLHKRDIVWYLVADSRHAQLYAASGGVLEAILPVPMAAEEPRKPKDAPARVQESAKTGMRHAIEPKTTPQKVVRERFARAIAERLEGFAELKSYDKLVLVAPVKMLGDIRAALPAKVVRMVKTEMVKDLAGLSLPKLTKHLLEGDN